MTKPFYNVGWCVIGLLLSLCIAAQADSVLRLNVPCNDVVYSPLTQRLYITVRPDAEPKLANSITTVNPTNGTIEASFSFGAQPYRLAISDDGKVVYVALDNSTIRKFDVLKGSVVSAFFHNLNVTDLEVQPGNANVVAASNIFEEIKIFNNGAPLARTGRFSYRDNILEWGSPSSLYSLDNTTSIHAFSQFGVTAAEYSITRQDRVLGAPRIDMRFAGGDIFLSNGYVFDAQALNYKGHFPVPDATLNVCPDLEHNRVFFVNETGLLAYDLTTFRLIGQLSVPDSNIARRLVRWGDDGLAWIANNKLVIVRTALTTKAPPSAQPLPVNAEVNGLRPISLPGNDLLYDAINNRLLVAVPGLAPDGYSNSITPITPQTGQAGTPVFVGSEPEVFGEADDHETLWVGIFNALRRVQISSLTPQQRFPLDNNGYGPVLARDIAVQPGSTDTLALSQRHLAGYSDFAGVSILDNGIRRPLMVDQHQRFDPNYIEWGVENRLYGMQSFGSDYQFLRMAVSADGVAVVDERGTSIAAVYANIKFFEGRIYGTDGDVINPETTENLGHYGNGGQALCIDEKLRRIYFAAGNQGVGAGSQGAVIQAYNLDTFAFIGSQPLTGVSGEVKSLIRWGVDGLAFISFNRNNGARRVWVLHSALVNEDPKLTVQIAPDAVKETAGVNAATATLSRNFNLQNALTVQLFANRPDFEVPATVTIPAGDAQVTFPVGVKNNNVAEGTRLALITGRASGWIPGTGRLTIYDDEARLSLSVTPLSFTENAGAQAAKATVTRNTSTEAPLRVQLSSTDRSEAGVPGAVIIPAGASSVTFFVSAVNDDEVDGPQTPIISAYLTGYAPARQQIEVRDEDRAALSITLSKSVITESGGPYAVLLTVTRNAKLSEALTVTLQNNLPGRIKVPASVTIAAGARRASVWVAAIDDSIMNENQTASLRAIATFFAPAQTQLTIQDDD
jgi:hypothetical protein